MATRQGGGDGTFLNLGAVVYFLIVLPYKAVMARHGDSPPTKTCPACLSDELSPAAT
jgi:large conductance mechanosensitive channel